jgi:hypothetical protein
MIDMVFYTLSAIEGENAVVPAIKIEDLSGDLHHQWLEYLKNQ